MDTAPVGREFGSPDYERLAVEDAAAFNSNLLAWIQVSRSRVSSEELSCATREFAADVSNIQRALTKLGHEVSSVAAASVWIQLSKSYGHRWMSGADSIESTARTLYLNCPKEVLQTSDQL